MPLVNAALKHRPDQYVVDNSNKTYMELITNCHLDFFTIWLGESGLKLWVRVWLCFLMMGVMSPFAFCPHPFAITNVLALVFVIMPLNGRELARIRGVNKNMGWPHIVGWLPVLIVNFLSLTTDEMGWGDGNYSGKLTWDNAGDSNYQKARFVVLIFNTVIIIISSIFDAVDTVLYYAYGEHDIERSFWTTDQLVLAEKEKGSATQVDDGQA